MNADTEITQWFQGLKAGEAEAVQQIWDRYYARLVGLARNRLRNTNRRVADEEDIATSAFHSFCKLAAADRIPKLDDRDDLWKLLVVITVRKSCAHIKYNRAAKRGANKVRGDSIFAAENSDGVAAGFGRVIGEEPTPEMAAMMAETCAGLVECLEPLHREIAIAKMEGYTNNEIADQLGISSRAVTRKLALIRKRWSREPSE